MKAKILTVTVIAVLLSSLTVLAGDPPHNPASGIECCDCHGSTLLDCHSPFWTDNTDDAAYSALCMRCHTPGNVPPYHGSNAPPIQNHKSIKCTTCHHNHAQDQIYSGKNNRDDYFLAQGTASGVDYDHGSGTTTITYSILAATDNSSYWAEDLSLLTKKTDDGRGAQLIPDTSSRKRWPLYMIVAIDDPDPNTIRVKGYLAAASNIAITYGQLIRSQVKYDPVHSTASPVIFYDRDDFADNDGKGPDGTDSTANGICQVCHEATRHWRNDGTMTENHFSGQNCIRCHSHSRGFRHCLEESTLCIDCHDPDDPQNPEPAYCEKEVTKCSDCHHTGSHAIHIDNDPRGPAAFCDACHDLYTLPNFKNLDGSGGHSLAETDICDTCHSNGGTYDGVNDENLGAKYGNNGEFKYNWDNGIYEEDGVTLKPGNDKWCATCHDESPSRISGVPAPNVIGDEDNSAGEGKYGGWGYYKSGHGLPSDEPYASKGGFLEPALKPGAARAMECGSCHDFSTAHIDGEPRTFNDNDDSETDPSVYRQGYRLKLVDGEEPMRIPWNSSLPNGPARYRLCAECHITRPFTSSSMSETNLISTSGDGTRNRHYTHLALMPGLWTKPDFEGDANSSRPTCTTCHNVHGSTQLAMVRDGKLINREPGMQMWYYNDDATLVDETNTDPPDPEDTPLAASDGNVWKPSTSRYLCSHCHGGNNYNTIKESREPFQDTTVAPTLDWTGETGFMSDGANPDSGVTGSTFTFRVRYIDINNDAPTQMQVWIDQDNNIGNGYENQLAMNADDPADGNYIDGRIYTLSTTLNATGSNTKNYRFYAANAPDGPATGNPTQNSSVYVFDAAAGGGNTPNLNWTSESGYVADGIDPDSGNSCQTSFTFRVDYSDTDIDPPALIQVWIDENDNGAYSAAEKFDMTVDIPGNRYTLGRVLNYNGDGTLNFRFYATDGTLEATGDPAAEQSVSLTNCIPVLSWTGEPNYIGDGIDPGTGQGGSLFTFRVKYTDDDNIAPDPIQAWVDTDNSSTYDIHEKYTMDEVDSGDTDCTTAGNGKLYTVTLPVPYVGNGNTTYRFYASDGADEATGDPVSDTSLVITAAPPANNAPVLSWTTADCLSNGVRPGVGAEQVDFEFKVIYTDTDNECASDILLLIDEDDSGIYESQEKHILTGDVGDTDCTDGRLYETTLNLASAGDQDLNYRFYATDGKEVATGIPVTSDSTVTVIDDPIKVRPSGGVGWLTTIQSAEDSSFNSSTIVVYPNDDFTAATYVENIEARTVNLTMRSACGPDLTIIDGGGSSTGALLRADDQVLDGFSVTNAVVGIYVNPGPNNVTIKNNKIYGIIKTDISSGYGINVNTGFNVHIENNEIYNNQNAGIRGNGSTLDIKNCDIHNNLSVGITQNGGDLIVTDSLIRENSGGIYFNGVGEDNTVKDNKIYDNTGYGIKVNSGNHVLFESNEIYGNGGRGITINNAAPVDIVDCDIHHNTDGGIYFNGGVHTLTDTLIRENSAVNGGGVHFNNLAAAGTTFTNTTIRDNQASSRGGGMYIVGSHVTFDKCTITGNQTTASGGGMYVQNASNPVFRNTIIAENQAVAGGGAAYVHSGRPDFFNVTFANNKVTGGYGGVFRVCVVSEPVVVRNSIFWGNTASVNGDIGSRYGCNGNGPLLDVTNSNVSTASPNFFWGVVTHSDNIDPAQDPLFAGSGNYHITSGSPVIDKASATYAPADDIDGEARPLDIPGVGNDTGDPSSDTHDMGADEYHL